MNIPAHIPDKQLVRYVLEKSEQSGCRETWFVEDIEPWDVTNEHVRLNLTKYRLPTHERIEKVLETNVSRLRWVLLVSAEVRAGSASGYIIMNKRVFKLNYAWGGLSSKEDYHTRESYSVQIEGRGCERFINSYVQQIIKEEGEISCVGSILGFSYMHTIKPYMMTRKKK